MFISMECRRELDSTVSDKSSLGLFKEMLRSLTVDSCGAKQQQQQKRKQNAKCTTIRYRPAGP